MASTTATTEFAGQRVKSVACHPDWPTQKLLVVTTHKGEVIVHDLEAGASAVSRQLLPVADAHCAVRAVAWTPLGIIAGSDDGCVRLLDAATLKTLATAASSDAPAHADYVRSISTSPDGSLVATSADDKVVRVWHLAVGEDGTVAFSMLATSDAQPHYMMAAAFAPGASPDSWSIAAACLDGTILSLVGGAGAELAASSERRHAAGVNAVAFTPSGKLLLSAGDDGVVKVTEFATGRTVATGTGHSHNVTSVVALSDTEFASCGEDATVCLWSVPADSAVTAAAIVPTATHAVGSATGAPWQYPATAAMAGVDTDRATALLREAGTVPEELCAALHAHGMDGPQLARLAFSKPTAVAASTPDLTEAHATLLVDAALAIVTRAAGVAAAVSDPDAAPPAAAAATGAGGAGAGDGTNWGRAWCVACLPSKDGATGSLAVGTDHGLVVLSLATLRSA